MIWTRTATAALMGAGVADALYSIASNGALLSPSSAALLLSLRAHLLDAMTDKPQPTSNRRPRASPGT